MRTISYADNSRVTSMKKEWQPKSQTETFAALRLEINSWRWQGVPFYIRAGKNLPVTCTEIIGTVQKTSCGAP